MGSDLKFPRGKQQFRTVRMGSSRPPGDTEELEDLSAFSDEELIRESRREAIRRSRDNRHAARENEEMGRWERLALGRMLVFCAVVSALVILVGLCAGDHYLVRTGFLGFAAACGLGLYRLRDAWQPSRSSRRGTGLR